MYTIERPNLSFNDLIRLALLSKPNSQATLSQIYDFIQLTYPYYNQATECRFWKNSVRHNLCKNRQFQRIPSNDAGDSDNPYKRSHSLWQLCDSDTISSPVPRKEKPIRKRKDKTVDNAARTCTADTFDIYNSQYPWQPGSNGHSQSEFALDLSSTGKTTTPEPVSPSRQSFLQPWTTSSHHATTHSHFEAPQPEEFGVHPSNTMDNPHPEYQPLWLYEQDYSTSRGVSDQSALGGYSDVTYLEELRVASPISLSPNAASPFEWQNTHLPHNQQYLFTDGLFYYTL